MGFAVPAAMGAKVGRPDATVWAIDGDGCFQMTNQELATCTINDVPVVVEFVVHKDAMVWPMIAGGASNDEIKVARDMAPRWEGEQL